MNQVTFIIPTRNNLPYVQLAYSSIRKFYPETPIIILDDCSTDGTLPWLTSQLTEDDNLRTYWNRERQVGHTVLYDKGVELCGTRYFTIFHADMVCGPNYLENLLKHAKTGTVVSATRIEPPLHPPGKEKVVMDFGMYPEDFKQEEFEKFCIENSKTQSGVTTKGIFAPWLMATQDFYAIKGHDKFFAPFPFEDSDIFQRFILKGYEIVQSRDAFVFHFTCRGHRWSKEVGKDDYFYKLCVAKNQAHFIRKWGSWIENDEFSCPIITPKYDIGFLVRNCNADLLGLLEPWCSTIYTDFPQVKEFIDKIQPGTPFDLSKRIQPIDAVTKNNIVIMFDASKLTSERFEIITKFPKLIKDSGEVGKMEYDIFEIYIKSMESCEKDLIYNSDFYRTLRKPSASDEFMLDELFRVYKNTNPA
jgi:glycosyltransferase involved in cell wall biosynthesis